jgi:hypothetical protein
MILTLYLSTESTANPAFLFAQERELQDVVLSVFQAEQCFVAKHFAQAAEDVATALFHPGIDLFTKQEVYVARVVKDRKTQRALMQFFKPANYFTVREAPLVALLGRSKHYVVVAYRIGA